jgi:hypothetical protein
MKSFKQVLLINGDSMIIKLAFRHGGTVDQALSNGLLAAGYARLTKDKQKDMHHGKAMGIGAGIGAGMYAGGSIAAAKAFKKLKPNRFSFNKRERDLFKAVKTFKNTPMSKKLKALALLTTLGGLTGAGIGLGINAQTRTLRAAQRGQRDN